MKTSDFYYDLPQELIAQDPLEDRSSSRLMHLSLKDGSIEHRHFTDILDYLHKGDCLVINDTKVIPARLYGHKEETGALIEILLLKRRENDIWECLVKPGKKARPGAKITFGDGILKGEIIDIVDEGNRLIQFHYEGIFEEILDQLGEMPLPPYITHKLKDKNRYQTVYAKNEGSAAAPTAGLHFSPELLEKVKGARHYLFIECLLAYGAALANLIYVFKISVPVTWVGYTIICLFGGIFVGCLAGALTEVLNVIPIAARRFSVRRNFPYVIYGLAAGKLVGSVLSVVLGM